MLKEKRKKMFDIFVKKTDVVLDCFTYSHNAYEYAKIDYGNKYFPEWWKETPKVLPEAVTIKNCTAFMDFHTKGIVIPSWCELKIHIYEYKNDEGFSFKWNSSDGDFDTKSSHSNIQWDNFSLDNGFNMKFTSPWRMKTKEEIYFSWTQPTWHLRECMQNFSIIPGVMNFKYQHSSNINYIVIQDNEAKDISIPVRTPLVMMHPMTEKNVIIKNHLIDRKEFDEGFDFSLKKLFLEMSPNDMLGFSRKKKKLIDEMDEINNDKKKCPFHR